MTFRLANDFTGDEMMMDIDGAHGFSEMAFELI
jgi:hypothetical protein